MNNYRWEGGKMVPVQTQPAKKQRLYDLPRNSVLRTLFEFQIGDSKFRIHPAVNLDNDQVSFLLHFENYTEAKYYGQLWFRHLGKMVIPCWMTTIGGRGLPLSRIRLLDGDIAPEEKLFLAKEMTSVVDRWLSENRTTVKLAVKEIKEHHLSEMRRHIEGKERSLSQLRIRFERLNAKQQPQQQ